VRSFAERPQAQGSGDGPVCLAANSMGNSQSAGKASRAGVVIKKGSDAGTPKTQLDTGLVNMLTQSQQIELRNAFRRFDLNNNGTM
jgi:ApbE superfamily uncharacterized protein (UPF0280 family)